MSDVDPFTLEIIESAFVAIGDEMFSALQRAAQSSLIYEVLDFAVGATDGGGELISQGIRLLEVPSLASGDATTRETRFAARQALAQLPDAWQVLLVAHYVEGESLETLSKLAGKSRATVNRELRKARQAFRSLLTDEHERGRADLPASDDIPIDGSGRGSDRNET